jgi:hypothetical protein
MRFDGLYRGIVIQNNDPLNSGRVKVFVPGFNLTQLKDWNQNKEEDKYFRVLGSNTNSALAPEILQNQKEKLFWAEVMMPVVGMSSPGFYHAPSDTFYIGNDSDYKFQDDNKSSGLFSNDSAQANIRLTASLQLPSYGKLPRIDIDLNFKQTGSKACVNSKCSDNDKTDIPNKLNNSNSASKNNPIIGELPKVYTDIPDVTLDNNPNVSNNPLDTDGDIDNTNIPNDSVVGVEISISNPEIYLNDKLVPKTSPIYNPNCYIAPNNINVVNFQPPILFKTTSGTPAKSYDTVPVSLKINGRAEDSRSFVLDSSNDKTVTYKSNDLKVVVPKENVNEIIIINLGVVFNYQRIKALKPLLTSNTSSNASSFSSTPIMPRTPKPTGETLQSRGGGGGEIFNTITSLLLPLFMRKDSHIGGANNECRGTVNKGRIPLNDPNNTKGCNTQQSNAGQAHRGPMRSADYNNSWKGIISVPGVGAHVWIRFESGDPNYPIVIGTFMAQADYKGVYKTETVPEKTEEPEDPVSPTSPTTNPAGLPENPEESTDGPDSSLFPPNAEAQSTDGTKNSINGRQTSYGYANDPYKDSRSAKGIGAFVPDAEEAKIKAGQYSDYKLRTGDIALSRDIESSFRKGGISPGQNVTVNYADGTTHTGRWMDRTADYLSNRVDLYSPNGPNPRDGAKITSFSK